MTGLLLDTKLTAEQREFAELIKCSRDAMLAVINGILDFSKIEAGKMELELIDFDLITMLEDTFDIMKPRIASRNLEFAYFIDSAVPPMVRGDPAKLRQVLVNLLDKIAFILDRLNFFCQKA